QRRQAADPGIALKPGGGNLVGAAHRTPSFPGCKWRREPHVERLRGSRDDGQKSSRTQISHFGDRASHTRRPWRIKRRLSPPRSAAGTMALRANSIFTGSVWSVRPRRRDNRATWVSTGRPGSLNHTLRTTLAVLRPTPGSVTRSSRALGTSPPNRSTTP